MQKVGNSNLNRQRTEDRGSREFKSELALGEMSTRKNAFLSYCDTDVSLVTWS